MTSGGLAQASDWGLEPGTAHLNHGGFGATPLVVLDRQAELRRELEANPTGFLLHRLPALLQEVRAELSGFLGTDPARIAFLANATEATQTVIANFTLSPGEEVLTTDHCYPAVLAQLRRATDSAGARLRVLALPLTLAEPAVLCAAIADQLRPNTRWLVIDHVASPSGMVFPVEEIIHRARQAGVRVLVDGAHAAGMLAVDLTTLGADFWVGNLHKWVCAPKSAAVLVAGEPGQLRPLVASHGFDDGYPTAFDWTGTRDPTAVLSVPAALAFFARLGWDRVRSANNALAAAGSDLVIERIGGQAPLPATMTAALRLIPLPQPLAEPAARALELELLRNHRVVVPVTNHGGWWWIRVSAQLYNSMADFERLSEALPEALSRVSRDFG